MTMKAKPSYKELVKRVQELEKIESEHKNSKEALRESESLFKMLYEKAPLGYQSLDENGHFIVVNQTWLDTLGYTEEEVIGKSFADFLHPDWRDHFKENFPRFKSIGEVLGVEFEMVKKNGDLILVSFTGKISRDKTGNFQQTHCIFHDITERKQAEKALIEKEALFRGLFDHMTSGSAVYEVRNDGSKGTDYIIREFNRKSLEMEGKKLEEVMGRSLFDLRPNIDDYGLISAMKKVWETGIPDYYPTKLYQDDRFSNYYENHIFKLPSGEVVTIYNDVTDKKNQERDLQESEKKYRVLFDTLPLGITVTDQSGNIVESNATSEKLLGIAKTEQEARTIDAPVWRIVRPDGTPMPAAEYASVRALKEKRQIENVEMGIVKSDTEITWLNVSATPLHFEKYGVVVIYGDITESKRIEKALQESEARFKALHNASFGGIAIHDKGIIIECNHGLSEMTGYSMDELIGMDGLLLIAEKSRPAVMNNILSGYEKPYEAIGLRKNGEEFPIRLEARNVPYKGKQVRTVEFRDITEQKKSEIEREKLQVQLTQAQKMESIGRLAGGVAHDFNNMLGVILGHAELAMENIDENQTLYADLQEIQTSAQRSADLTRQLLTFARKQIIDPQMLDLNDTVESMLNMMRRLIGENIDFGWKPAGNLWPVQMDPSQVHQILANLCVNARDAITGVGKLIIETGMKTFDQDYCAVHAGFVPGDFVLLAVSDNGCGMDKETQDNLFEPFFTTKELGEGTGLGLATVYGIVKQNNGFINVYSKSGQGSTFKIYLPRYTGAEQASTVISEKKTAHEEFKTILLVEDEPSILRITRMMLERKGHTVLSAGTPNEALGMAKDYADDINLLMTDVVMPGMNGRDLARKMTGLYPDIKLLFMSGHTANVIAHQGVLDEGVAFIQKPFSMKDLAEKLRGILDKASGKIQQ